MSNDLIFLFCAFLFLCILSFDKIISNWKQRSNQDVLLDLSGLFVQGSLIPLGSYFFGQSLKIFFPQFGSGLDIPSWLCFLIPFILIDYIYYWNHRILHSKKFWPAHQVHHAATMMDIFVTSRNTIYTPMFIVYFWSNSIFIFLLSDPRPFLWATALSAALDLWRHSDIDTPALMRPILRKFLILPEDHRLHHGKASILLNFGANLNLWDRLHGTFESNDDKNPIGVPLTISFWKKLFYPWRLS